MMIAAIYARKSTDDSDRNAEARSPTRQIERATGVDPVSWRVNCFRNSSPHPLRGGYQDSAPWRDRRS
jgi:hypothetical protein